MKTYKAFTLVETLSSVAIVGLLAAIALTYAGSSRTVGLDTKLNTDVSALNQALASYVGFGGSVSDIDNPIDVLTRLKSQQLQSETSQSAGLTGSYVDLRLRALLMDESEAKSNDLRAIWDPDAAQFVISRSGFPAVKAFYLSSDEEAVQFESRPQFFTYAAEDKWVWDFQDRPPYQARSNYRKDFHS
ncbi:MAG: type II secretion system protein [Verrucomicrobiales bacterium]